jgi:hypothetical protein
MEDNTNYRNTYYKKLVNIGPAVNNPTVVPAGGDCWPNKMHYRSSLNATPLNTLQEKCNSANPPPNTIDYTQLGGTLVPGTNFVAVPGKYPATPMNQNYGSVKTCTYQCERNPDCVGVATIRGWENDENGTCLYFDKNTDFWDTPLWVSYKRAYLPDLRSATENPGMIKMTGASVNGTFTIDGAPSMNGTALECESKCNSNMECGGFVRGASLADDTVGECKWKSLLDTTPDFNQSGYPYPYPLISEKVVLDSTTNLWRKQPRQTRISGIDAPEMVPLFDTRVYRQPSVNGYEIREGRFPNGIRMNPKVRGTVDMCAQSCTNTDGCNSFTHPLGIDDDQVADCYLYAGSTNKNTNAGLWGGVRAFHKV